MSVSFPNNTASTKIDYGALSLGSAADIFTVAFWFYPTETRSWGTFWCTDDSAGKHYAFFDASAGMYVDIKRVTTGYSYYYSGDRPTINTWNFVAITVDLAGGSLDQTRLYLGTLTTPATLRTPTTSDEGSGGLYTAGNMHIGAGPTDVSVGGRYGMVYVNPATRLSLGQIHSLQFRPRMIDGNETVLSWPNGTTAPDFSGAGNAGTVSNGSLGLGVPIGPRFAADAALPYIAAAAISLLDSTAAGSSDSNSVTSASIDTTGATVIVVAISDYVSATATTLSDNQTNSWTKVSDYTDGNARVRIYHALSPSTSATHTFTATGTTAYPSIAVAAFDGVVSYDAEVGASAPATSATHSPGAITPSADDGLVFSVCANWKSTNGITVDSVDGGFTLTDQVTKSANAFGIGIAYLAQGTAASANPVFTHSASCTDLVAASAVFLSTAAAGGLSIPVAMAQYRQRWR